MEPGNQTLDRKMREAMACPRCHRLMVVDTSMSTVSAGFDDLTIHLSDLEGNPAFISDLRGNVVLLNFCATWCGPCRVEMPATELLYRDFKREDFEIFAHPTVPQRITVTRPSAS